MEDLQRTDVLSMDVPILTARCRARGGSASELVVLDLTTAGCLVATGGLTLKVNQRVLVKLLPLEVLAGKIIWVEDRTAGIEFERPLYKPVLDHLRRHFRL
jgi:hypothetical protein